MVTITYYYILITIFLNVSDWLYIGILYAVSSFPLAIGADQQTPDLTKSVMEIKMQVPGNFKYVMKLTRRRSEEDLHKMLSIMKGQRQQLSS